MWPFAKRQTTPAEKELPTIGRDLASIDKDIAVGLTSFELFGTNQDNLTTKSRKLLFAYEGWVYANVKTIAQKVAEMQFKLYTTSFSKGEMVFEEIDDHELLDLLDRFNPFTTCSDALFTIEAHLSLVGDAFIYKARGAGKKVEHLFALDPTKITIVPGDITEGYMIKSYDFNDTIEGKQTTVSYAPEDIVQIKEANPANPYRGKSPVEAAAQIIDTDTLAGEYNKNFFKNGAVPNNILSTDQKLTPDQIDRLEKRLKRNFGGVSNSNKTAILSGGLTMQDASTKQRDMEFQAQQQWSRDKIMALFGNTKTSLGITEDVNRANAEATLYGWLKHSIKPRMRRICDSMNEFLVPEYGDNLILGFEDPLPEDRNSLIDEVEKLVANAPILTVDEARQMIDEDPLPNGEGASLPAAAGGNNVSA